MCVDQVGDRPAITHLGVARESRDDRTPEPPLRIEPLRPEVAYGTTTGGFGCALFARSADRVFAAASQESKGIL